MSTRSVSFSDLSISDLIIDATYEGGVKGNAGDDPISKLIGCENQGGFRPVGSRDGANTKFCVLYTDLSNSDWPDRIEIETGKFYYFGDNRESGRELHNTPKRGNLILRYSFDQIHKDNRKMVPPFFVFTKGGKGRDVVFRGLAVPGTADLNEAEDLVAIWKLKEGNRFQNYRAVFTILNVASISRAWIHDIHNGLLFSQNAPREWIQWIETGKYTPLAAEKTIEYRKISEQIPSSDKRREVIQCIVDFFKAHPRREYAFEECAAKIAQIMDNNIIEYDLTRPWRDGGRDAIGKYRIGMNENAIYVDFALEAKCKKLDSGSGVRETSRLIARLRYRQFGIFVTTSYVNQQAYEEIKVDGHPVIIICGEDIVKILEIRGLRTPIQVKQWLQINFPN
ncbi:restriction endonuclease [Paenibacillus sp. MAH-36]|uniref:Restriction endonuclease n=1 Tax=Paenibacillus violae TaxID=3077234 RepID=A0ABU3RNF0_9BACL|nr:restriction endonuclease [Paenibacillus sp. PFR10]MDU0205815.1 restriction endonuclease [Paenibacillus sp. PFR10]